MMAVTNTAPPSARTDLAVIEASYRAYFAPHPVDVAFLLPSLCDAYAEPIECHGITDLDDLVDLDTLHGRFVRERLDVDRGAAAMLASILSNVCDPIAISESSGTLLSSLKLEERVVISDTEVDKIRSFERNMITLTSDGMPRIFPDIDQDEALQWPTNALNIPERLLQQVIGDRLDLTRETASHLKELLGPMQPISLVNYQRPAKREDTPRIATPLLPPATVTSVASLAPPEADIQMTSSPDDSDVKIQQLIEQRVAADCEFLEDVHQHDPDSELTEFDIFDTEGDLMAPARPCALPSPDKRLHEFKVDCPVLPLGEQEPPAKKHKSAHALIDMPSLDLHVSSTSSLSEGFQRGCEIKTDAAGLFTDFAERLDAQLKDETLEEADTVIKLPLPRVPSVITTASSQCNERTSTKDHYLRHIRPAVIHGGGRWTGTRILEKELPWHPFPARLGKVKLETEFDDGSLARYMADLDLDGETDLQAMMWRPDELALLHEDEHDEEEDLSRLRSDQQDAYTIQASVPHNDRQQTPAVEMSDSNSFESLSEHDMTNRRASIPLQDLLAIRKQQMDTETAVQQGIAGTGPAARGLPSRPQSGRAVGLDLMGASGLVNFMRLQGQGHDLTRGAEDAPPEAARGSASMNLAEAESAKVTVSEVRMEPAIPMPDIIDANRPMQVVVSSRLMFNHFMIRALQNHLPNLEFVERDHNVRAQAGRITHDRISGEADLALSPSTGLMMTTLQTLRQRALPGDERHFVGFRHRLASVAKHFERLVVLVSQGDSSGDGKHHALLSLDARDCDVYTSLAMFAAELDAETHVHFVPGGEAELAAWTASMVSQHAVSVGSVRLLHEETTWERFLSHTGLNSFAAQSVLAALKGASEPALVRFVNMSEAERVQCLSAMLGGERLLTRTGRVVDTAWATSGL